MFDLVGYWVAVTITSFILVLPYLLGTIALLDGMLYRISSGEVKYFVTDRITGFLLNIKTPEIVSLGIISATSIFSVTLNLITLAGREDPLEVINKIATILASFTSWLCLIILVLLTIDFVGKKLYKLSKAIKKIQDTIDE